MRAGRQSTISSVERATLSKQSQYGKTIIYVPLQTGASLTDQHLSVVRECHTKLKQYTCLLS